MMYIFSFFKQFNKNIDKDKIIEILINFDYFFHDWIEYNDGIVDDDTIIVYPAWLVDEIGIIYRI